VVPRVKICGITSLDDARAAVDAGADALGFNFYAKSPRFIALKKAAEIIQQLPPFVAPVALFVDPTEGQVLQALGACRWGSLQFHGDEDPGFMAAFPWDLQIKALRLKDKRSLSLLKMYPRVAALLVDASVPGQFGGTGQKARWDLAREAGKKKPVILAGGLTPENVAQAVKEVRPYGVDTASGVEKKPGKKDPAKMRAFVRNAKLSLAEAK
jgi:phosphoribosylanthranilate isomerase